MDHQPQGGLTVVPGEGATPLTNLSSPFRRREIFAHLPHSKSSGGLARKKRLVIDSTGVCPIPVVSRIQELCLEWAPNLHEQTVASVFTKFCTVSVPSLSRCPDLPCRAGVYIGSSSRRNQPQYLGIPPNLSAVFARYSQDSF
jgi:hypothetical protein